MKRSLLISIISVVLIVRGNSSPQGEFVNTKLTVSLYYESLCPDCVEFIQTQLYPAIKRIGTYFNADLIPYGNAMTWIDHHTGTVNVQCQHGKLECVGNVMHACALTHFPQSQQIPFIACAMTGRDPEGRGRQCAQTLGLDFGQIENCTNGTEGFNLLLANGNRTDQLKPRHKFVPWILFDGHYNKRDMAQAQDHLLPSICKHLQQRQEPLPDECNEL